MTNWDTYLYTREFAAINDDRSMRQVERTLYGLSSCRTLPIVWG
jgi:hypothetical protein